ncbi:MAG TPA: chemotaxis protein CheW [Blastocatellia bacterium]|nr:chemotaxis protein CheW [Blastocatellia bacterium]
MAEDQAKNQNASEPFILFELAGTTYGVPSRAVQQVELVEHITPVPNAPPAVEGVIFSRGQVIPAVNLRVRFGFEKSPHDLRTRLIVINAKSRVIGLIVDSAREFISIPSSTIQPPNEAISGLKGKYLEGIATLGERIILILSLDEVIDMAEVIATAPESA